MYLIFDTETTGLPKNWRAPITDLDNWPRVVQLAWISYNENQEPIAEKNLIVKPTGFTIPTESSDIHGITHERAMDEGILLGDALAEFLAALSQSKVIAAHNLDYDQKVMSAEYLRNEEAIPFSGKQLICTKTSSTDYCQLPGKYGFKWPTLAELHQHLFAEGFDGAHDALNDVRATGRCFFELKNKNVI